MSTHRFTDPPPRLRSALPSTTLLARSVSLTRRPCECIRVSFSLLILHVTGSQSVLSIGESHGQSHSQTAESNRSNRLDRTEWPQGLNWLTRTPREALHLVGQFKDVNLLYTLKSADLMPLQMPISLLSCSQSAHWRSPSAWPSSPPRSSRLPAPLLCTASAPARSRTLITPWPPLLRYRSRAHCYIHCGTRMWRTCARRTLSMHMTIVNRLRFVWLLYSLFLSLSIWAHLPLLLRT